MIDIAAIKARADKATAGGWIVIETTHPYKFTPSRPEFKGEGFHVERRIATAWDHPQLKDKYPLVNIATGIGTPESGAVHMCSIEADDADFIAHARTDIPALLAALEASKSARVKAEQERDGYRSKLMQLADATEVSGMSWSGFNVLGDKKSIKAVQSAVHYAGQIEEYRTAFADRLKQVEQERDALKEALTNSCDLLESYIDTFGDMSGANRADLNDYRRALESKP